MREKFLPLNEQQLHELAVQEARFFAGISTVIEEECGTFLFAPDFSDYVGANRALALRDDGRGAKAVADTMIEFYKTRGIRPAVELDAVAESQGIGSELRRGGLRSSVANRLLMRYDAESPPILAKQFEVKQIPNDSGNDEAHDWLEISISHETNAQDQNEWRNILRCDAQTDSHQLFIAYDNEIPAAGCQLFSDSGYGRIDDVTTRPEFERRGFAAAIVAHAITVSLQAGNHTTFLYCDAESSAESLYRKLGFVAWERNPFRRHFVPVP